MSTKQFLNTLLVQFSYPKRKEKFPIYYVSKALLEGETRYSQLEKLALALVTPVWKIETILPKPSHYYLKNLPVKEYLA